MIPKEILKKIRHIEIRTRNKVNDVFAGQYHSAFKGQGMEFQEVREYLPGDDIRSIDWNVTARMNHPFVKKFTEERELTIFLVVDISASHLFGSGSNLKKDVAAEIAAILAFAAIQNNDRVGLILHTDIIEKYVPPQKGARHVLRVISEVLNFKPEHRGTDPVPALDFLNKFSKRKAVVFMVSDFQFPESFKRPLAVTARHHDVVAVVIGDKLERSWPRMGIVEWQDAETGKRYLLDTANARTRRRLTRLQTEKRSVLLSGLRKAGVDAVEVNASEPYEREFMKFFRLRAHRLGAG